MSSPGRARLHPSPLAATTPPGPISPNLPPNVPRSPHSPHSPLSSPLLPSSQHAQQSYASLPIEYPPGFNAPAHRSRTRRSSVSAESDRPAQLVWRRRKVDKTSEQRERIAAAIPNSILFSGLDKGQQEEIVDAMEEVRVGSGELVIRQGEEGDYFYIIDTGVFDVYVKRLSANSNASTTNSTELPIAPSASSDGVPASIASSAATASTASAPSVHGALVFTYDNRGFFGELALMYNCPRAATVVARSDGVLWRLDRETFRHLVIQSTADKRKRLEAALEGVPLLANLSKQERAQVADAMETKHFEPAATVLQQGEIGESVYFVVKGQCVATQQHPTRGDVEVGRIQTGGYFGERSLLTNEARAATVRAGGDGCEVGVMDRSGFERLLGSVKDIMHRQISGYRRADEIEGDAAERLRGGAGAEVSGREEEEKE